MTVTEWDYLMARYGGWLGTWYLRLKQAKSYQPLHLYGHGKRMLTREFFVGHA